MRKKKTIIVIISVITVAIIGVGLFFLKTDLTQKKVKLSISEEEMLTKIPKNEEEALLKAKAYLKRDYPNMKGADQNPFKDKSNSKQTYWEFGFRQEKSVKTPYTQIIIIRIDKETGEKLPDIVSG